MSSFYSPDSHANATQGLTLAIRAAGTDCLGYLLCDGFVVQRPEILRIVGLCDIQEDPAKVGLGAQRVPLEHIDKTSVVRVLSEYRDWLAGPRQQEFSGLGFRVSGFGVRV
jgi:hypothetical protein